MKINDIIGLLSQKQKLKFKLLAQQASPKDYIDSFLELSSTEHVFLQELKKTLKNDLCAALSSSPQSSIWSGFSWTVEDVRSLLGPQWPGHPYLSDQELRNTMVSVLCR